MRTTTAFHWLLRVLLNFALCATFMNLAQAAPTPGFEKNAVEASILAYMVTNKPPGTNYAYFVQLSPENLKLLKQECGTAFHVFGTNDMQSLSEGFLLRGTRQTGLLLFIHSLEIHGDQAEARGVYSWGTQTGMSDSRYKLRRKSGTWHVVSSEIVCAS